MATNTYAYKVRDTTGRFREGKVRAGSENAVAEKLLGMGYVPLEVRRTGTGLQKEITLGRRKVTTKDLAIAARQLATMVDAGLSLLRALTILGEQVENPELRRVLVKVRQDVEAGHSLSAALAAECRTEAAATACSALTRCSLPSARCRRRRWPAGSLWPRCC